MEITGWVAIAILVFFTGQANIATYPEPLATKAECEKINKEALKVAPDIEGLIAVGVSCAPIVVKEVKNPKISSKPVPKELKV